ncbi:two-component system sensor histidine kinase RppB [Synechococcus sp. PCC 6312]|uniref:two-component system sensor histidine kinase RppB n=1 Tax=Synechococcus sp. (strain ATCC 27167 / PCC 6312) TaxID=195253 RepID=UPI00029F4640|nr:two-component system sensor histidine kinase RppB [Synechococcus sp. PCC 6312]AFY61059.1 histidine kinase [Synechococcus sp. PCC 6312]
MEQKTLFIQTKLKLAGYYTAVMSFILAVCSTAFYQLEAYNQWQALDRELVSITGTLHDGLEPILRHPGQIELDVERLIPSLCIVAQNCQSVGNIPRVHTLSVVHQDGYFINLFNLSKTLIATTHAHVQNQELTPLAKNADQNKHSIEIQLKTAAGQPWGYLEVGRTLTQYQAHLQTLQLFLLISYPLAVIGIGLASWWLAGISMAPIYQAYQRMQQFTADAAHELRTPVAAIQATLETRLSCLDEMQPESHALLKTLHRQSIRLNGLVQDLLLLSRFDLDAVATNFQACDLKQIILDLMEEFAAIALEKQIHPTLAAESDIYGWGDEEQLYRLLGNLIINALHYSPTLGTVTITLNHSQSFARISVTDQGVGIPLAEQARIFERFYRVGCDRSRRSGGTGLGLAIAQSIVQHHHGRISVQSQVGVGSTFTVELPLVSDNISEISRQS